jgi:hypothetical protein
VRGPGLVSLYTFPGFQRIGSFALPRQRQGEGVSVGPGSRIRVSSEGVRSPVWQVALPSVVVQRMQPSTPTPTSSPSTPASPSASASVSASSAATASASPDGKQDTKDATDGQNRWLMWSIPAVLVLGAVGIGLGLRHHSE